MATTTNNKLFKYTNDNDYGDLKLLADTMDTIDKGISLKYPATLTAENTYTVTTGLSKTSLYNDYSLKVKIPSSSSGAVKIIIDSCSAVPVMKATSSGLAAVKNFKAKGIYELVYEDGNFLCASGDNLEEVTVTSDKLLIDYSANDSNGEKVDGTMPNNGAKTATLNCGGSYTIPAGYHNGSGKVTANSLSSQTSANATAKDIIKDKTAWVNGSKITGTMPNQGSITPGNSIVQSGDKVYCRIPKGAYLTNASSGYPEISYPQGDVATALGITADKIVSGNTIGGIAGTATVDTMAKYVEANQSTVNVYTNADGTEEFKITTGFKPRFAMVRYFHSTYNGTTWVLFNYTGDKWYGIGKKNNNSSTSTYDTSHVMSIVSFENDGVIVKASPYYTGKVSWIISQ